MSLVEPATGMVGRDAELGLLGAALQRASAGETTAVLVAGEAGIGKSRLVREFRERQPGDALLLSGWCLDYGSTPAPYGPLPAILRGALAELGDAAAEAAGPGRQALRVLLPELGGGPVDRSAGPEGLREAIANVLEAAAGRHPLVVVVEDLHWADDATLSLLAFLLRALLGHRVLFVFTCRVDEVRRGGPVRAFLVESERSRLLERIELRRLNAVHVRELAEALNGPIGDAGFARLLERSDGVPFFIEELSCRTTGPLPDSLRDLLLVRFDALGDDARRVVRVLSASEAEVDHGLLAELAGFDDDRLDAGIREAVGAAIIGVRADEGYDFRHALLREAVHDDLLPGERARLHRSYAEALERRVAAGHVGLEAALAFHWHQAHDARRALVAAIAAMDKARNGFAFSTAARLGELALELWDQRPDAEAVTAASHLALLKSFGSTLRNAGFDERALAAVDLALAEIDDDTPPIVRVKLLRDKALYTQNAGRPGAVDLLRESLAAMTDVDDEHLRADLLNLLSGRLMVQGDLDGALTSAQQALEIGRRGGYDAPISVAANMIASCLLHQGDLDGSARFYGLAWEHAKEIRSQLHYWVNRSDTLSLLGRYREALRTAEAGIAHARELGLERSSGSILTENMVQPLLELGDVERAEELLSKDLTMRSFRIFRVYTTASRIRALIWRDRLEEAAGLFEEWRTTLGEAATLERQVWYSAVDVEMKLALASGRLSDAGATLERMLDDDGPRLAEDARRLLDGALITTALRADGDAAGALKLASRIRDAWAAHEAAFPEWTVLVRALLDGDTETLREAIVVADRIDGPVLFRSALRLELARALVASHGDRSEAAEALSEAAAIASRIGHGQLQRIVKGFADASRLGSPAARGDGAELTEREQQVLSLVAEGLSNRQIADRLFISIKTVSVHVSAVLRKLGAASRTEAAARFRSRDLSATGTR
jgi:DNA-binding NarL/FixJ family response regulator